MKNKSIVLIYLYIKFLFSCVSIFTVLNVYFFSSVWIAVCYIQMQGEHIRCPELQLFSLDFSAFLQCTEMEMD